MNGLLQLVPSLEKYPRTPAPFDCLARSGSSHKRIPIPLYCLYPPIAQQLPAIDRSALDHVSNISRCAAVSLILYASNI